MTNMRDDPRDPELDAILDPAAPPRPDTFLVRAKRADGAPYLIEVPNEHYDRVDALCNGQYADKSIAIGPRRWKE